MDIEQLQETLREAITPAFRDSLLAKGQARSMIWAEGVLPPGAPHFPQRLSYDLKSYAYSLLSITLRFHEQGGEEKLVKAGFEQSANALEAVVAKGDPNDPERSFHNLLAAAGFHLGGFSARAYSLLIPSLSNSNFSFMEKALALFILRDFNTLEEMALKWSLDENATDEEIKSLLIQLFDNDKTKEQDTDYESNIFDVIDLTLTQNFMRGLGAFLFALETGEDQVAQVSSKELSRGLEICQELNLIPQWWCYRIAIQLLGDLWLTAFHAVLPRTLSEGDIAPWQTLRSLYIALLNRRRRSEIELWPSQVKAARRAVELYDNLVVSLPTSAGKTRIAEICILRTLAEGKRVIYVTPLRALSAQIEANLHNTFGPLGAKTSTLYGSIGIDHFEEDVLRTSQIVVATPEKLDFAIRNDPSLIDDVGLIVLDEGHMIGAGEREVRYEIQVQRLLKRPDSDQRRIICLSAILPRGDQFDDFVNWLRNDQEGGAITSDWRPTRIKFGEVLWVGNQARLELSVGEERPFVPNFFSAKVPPKGKRTTAFPRDQRELVIATAWQLVKDGQSVLIYCPERRSVEPFAVKISELHNCGLLESVLTDDPSKLKTALTIGKEWLSSDHPILTCLQLGVAVHHGTLPTPFRKEIERLIRSGILKITVSSPTLAQGLNLTATALIFHSIYRNREIIKVSEFQNVIGRAGRAYIDTQGLVLFPIYQDYRKKLSAWRGLLSDNSSLNMESGLLILVFELINRLHRSLGGPSLEELLEYVVNNANFSWDFPEINNEVETERESAFRQWSQYLTSLDTAILSLIGDQEDIVIGEVANKLDEVLASSLWARRLSKNQDRIQNLLDKTLKKRAIDIWSESSAKQRKGYFLAGVGLSTGQKLDLIAQDANYLLVKANSSMLEGDDKSAIDAIIDLAERLFTIEPFIPDSFPEKWRDVLFLWLKGSPISNIGEDDITDVLRFIENGLIYKLPWGMEALRVRAQANQDDVEGIAIDNYKLDFVVPAVETGTLNRSAAILIQAGFTLRSAAIKAVIDTEAEFTNSYELFTWLKSDRVKEFTGRKDWPTPETSELWESFLKEFSRPKQTIWTITNTSRTVRWEDKVKLPPDTSIKVYNNNGASLLLSATYEKLGLLDPPIKSKWSGLLLAKVGKSSNNVVLTYYGPDDIDLT